MSVCLLYDGDLRSFSVILMRSLFKKMAYDQSSVVAHS